MQNLSEPTIAIVDDDPTFHYMIKLGIRQIDKPARLMHFYDGREAAKFIKDQSRIESQLPDLIFLDLNMPDIDGWAFLNEFGFIASSLTKKRMIIYVMSSSIDKEDIDRVNSNVLVKKFLVKPLSLDQLNAILTDFSKTRALI